MTTYADSNVNDTITSSSETVFSLAEQLQAQGWVRLILCVTWVTSGLLLVFFGWSSFFWLSKRQVVTKNKRRSVRQPLSTSAVAGGLGGLINGFLFASYLTIVIAAAICATRSKLVGPVTFFILWLLPGIIGAGAGLHWPILARSFSGLLAAACSTVVITAMFGVRTLIVRIIVVSILATVITAPLLIPRRSFIHFHILNASTSIIGMIAFLNGVALYAPPQAASAAWIDLWAILFAVDGNNLALNTVKSWGTSSFKGYIAGAVLGTLVGFAFEFLLHKEASQDADDQWNEYLGMYTQRLGKTNGTELQNRMGIFQPAPTGWQKFSSLFTTKTYPGSYQNLTPDQQIESRALTEMSRVQRRSMAQSRSARSKTGPAKFKTLSARDQSLDEVRSDSDATEIDSDDEQISPKGYMHPTNNLEPKQGLDSRELTESADDRNARLALLLTGDLAHANVRDESALSVRPPSYRTNTGKSVTELSPSASPTTVSSFRPTSPPLSPTVSVAATPSLLNALARIQAAQAQALTRS